MLFKDRTNYGHLAVIFPGKRTPCSLIGRLRGWKMERAWDCGPISVAFITSKSSELALSLVELKVAS